MPNAVLITGAFRSGTSLVAQAVHRLGWQVAAMIPAPAPPTFRSDWEDGSLTLRLIRGERPGVVGLRHYLDRRVEESTTLGFGGRFALKSPYLALIWPQLMEAFGEARPLVMRTYRNELDRLRSLEAHPQLSLGDDKAIRAALLRVAPDMELGYEWMVENPLLCAGALAERLGMKDDAAIAAAAALIGAPTRYTQWPTTSAAETATPEARSTPSSAHA